MKTRNIILASAIILVVVFAVPIVIIYTDPTEGLYDEARGLYYAKDYAGAIEKYQDLIQNYPNSFYAGERQIDTFFADCYYNWAVKLANEQDYAQAIEKYENVRDYPRSDSTYYTNASERENECYYKWGQYLQSQKNYADAIVKYESVDYGNSHDEAERAIGTCYYEWIINLIATQKYDQALEKYFTIIGNYTIIGTESEWDWARAENTDILKDVSAEVLLTWATKLRQEESYDYAIKLYDTVVAYNSGTSFASEAEKAIIDTEISKIAEGKHGALPPAPQSTQQQLGGKAEYVIDNNTGHTLTVFLSGPTTTSAVISISGTQTLTLEPGTYRVAATVDAYNVNPFYGEDTLAGDRKYEYEFYIS